MKSLFPILFFLPAAAVAADFTWQQQCQNGVCQWVQVPVAKPAPKPTPKQAAKALPSLEQRVATLESKVQRLEDIVAASPENYKAFEPKPIKSVAGGTSVSPITDTPAAELTSRVVSSTCSCAATGYCACDPAVCECAACRDIKLPAATAVKVSQPAVMYYYQSAAPQRESRRQARCRRWGFCQ